MDLYSKKICFVRNKRTGRFLRGSKFFPWVKNWRHAWMTSPDVVRQYFETGSLAKYGILRMRDIELVMEPVAG